MLLRRVALPLALIGLLALSGCGDDEPEETTATDGVSCEYPESQQPAAKGVEPPPATATDTGSVPVTITTSVGELALTLDADAAPCTVNSFLSLAEQGYFDGTTCHRLTTAENGISVLQCGDPSASGSGGPGYTIADELSGQETYPAGTLAMAKTSEPDSGGSQFFFVYGDTPLPPEYTVFGSFDEAGVELIQGVAEQGSDQSYPDGSGRPNQAVDIESVSIDKPAS